MLASRKALPDIELFAGPPMSVGVAGASVHQANHLVHRCMAVGHDRLDEQFAHEGVERRLVPPRVGTSRLESLLVEWKRNVLYSL